MDHLYSFLKFKYIVTFTMKSLIYVAKIMRRYANCFYLAGERKIQP